ncbi:hypothetical protein [Geotalea uraniireducens]|uniref:hypothetical protein n=1 Tax=Geotalea uraniireducens TaxID=351604 RepID=UPI00059DDB86|nr:hypothetical protein [Geotalea uraniireducens]
MLDQIIKLILTAMIGIGTLAWGVHGIANKKKIKDRADYILSVGQVLGGIVIIIAVIIYSIFKLKP